MLCVRRELPPSAFLKLDKLPDFKMQSEEVSNRVTKFSLAPFPPNNVYQTANSY